MSNFFVVDTLRAAYPRHHLTQAYPSARLLDFINTGDLQAELETQLPHYVARVRDDRFQRVTDRTHLCNDVQFGRYRCSWQNHDFYIYQLEWYPGDYSIERQFILFPQDCSAHSSATPSVVDELLVAAYRHGAEVGQEIWLYDRDQWSKNQRLFASVRKSLWSNVILEKALKEELMNDVTSFFDRQAHYDSFGVPWKRGIIFHGLPGNGKTISIKALMHSLAVRPQQIPTLYVKSLGNKADHDAVREIFEKARETAPCMLVFEDLDSLVRENVRSFFLNEIDGLESNHGILMIGSTNHLDKLDPAITKRPSRFDRKYHFGLPGTDARRRYCEHWQHRLSKNGHVSSSVEFAHKMADLTAGMSFAYLQEIMVSAMVALIDSNSNPRNPSNGDTNRSTSSVAATGDIGRQIDLDSDHVWTILVGQINKIRREMEESRQSVHDDHRNTVLSDVGTKPGRRPGFE